MLSHSISHYNTKNDNTTTRRTAILHSIGILLSRSLCGISKQSLPAQTYHQQGQQNQSYYYILHTILTIILLSKLCKTIQCQDSSNTANTYKHTHAKARWQNIVYMRVESKNTYKVSHTLTQKFILFRYLITLKFFGRTLPLCVCLYIDRSLTTVTIPSRLKEIGKSDFIVPQTCVTKSVMLFVLCVYHFSTHRKCQPIQEDQKCVKDLIQHNSHRHIYT